MTANIESIELLRPQDIKERFGGVIPSHADGKPLATIVFKFPCKWTTLTIQELFTIIRLWIKAEEERYPPSEGFKGRWLFFDAIKRVFNEV